MRILITNYAMALWAGTETVVRDIAIHLKRRGHEPAVYTHRVGAFAEQLEKIGVPVSADLASFAKPDVIHGQHKLARAAMEHFPGVPALFYCHGAQHPSEEPIVSPRVFRYLAVDEPCHDRILATGVPADRVQRLLSFIDTRRFAVRDPLPERPRRALVYSNYLTADTGLAEIHRACALAGIALDVVGVGVGGQWQEPERKLPEYDIVFAKARAAQEALVVGCAVALCDAAGLGPWITLANFDQLRPLNFGFRALTSPISTSGILDRLVAYNAATSTTVSQRARIELSHETAIDALEAVYRELLSR